jgi:hypothetical protein
MTNQKPTTESSNLIYNNSQFQFENHSELPGAHLHDTTESFLMDLLISNE